MDPDRNLLFGVICMQAGLIDAAQFVEVCSHWASRKDVALGDLLTERGWINETDRSHVLYLLERRVEKHAGDVQAGLASVPAAIKRSLADIGDADIQKSLAHCASNNQGVAETVVFTVPPCVPESGERYELLALHEVGGVGRVWLAQDKDLGRMIALKELKP